MFSLCIRFCFQHEEFDESNIQISPPGFHVIFLPYAEDLRKVNLPQTLKGLSVVVNDLNFILKFYSI